jgi:hypothetical protein
MHVWYPSTAVLMLGDKLIQNILLSSSPSQWQVTTVCIHRVDKCMAFQLEYSSSEKTQARCWQPRQTLWKWRRQQKKTKKNVTEKKEIQKHDLFEDKMTFGNSKLRI